MGGSTRSLPFTVLGGVPGGISLLSIKVSVASLSNRALTREEVGGEDEGGLGGGSTVRADKATLAGTGNIGGASY